MTERPQIHVSIVVPVMNEADSVPQLADEITRAMNRYGGSWECIWVDDGSTDSTVDVVTGLTKDNRHRLVVLDGNYGQSAALSVGFREARGAIIGTLDGDGQNDPADLPAMLERLAQGPEDVVNGVRAKRRDTVVRRLSSRLANGFRNTLTHERVTDVGCAIRVFRAKCTRGLPVFKGMHRFLPTLFRLQGYSITEMPVNHRPRTKGVTKYGINNRLWVGIADTFAVCWMRRRLVYPRVRPEEASR
jgi:dolichol-phosphate mannosyltransferase